MYLKNKLRGGKHEVLFTFGKSTKLRIFLLTKNNDNETFTTDDNILGEMCCFIIIQYIGII